MNLETLQKQFYQCFLENNRWVSYLKGLRTSVLLTLTALVLGIIIGVLIAVVRTSYDQKTGKKGILLSIINLICKIYVTVIRGTPMMVQLLIMWFVIFASSSNDVIYWVAALSLGINSGAYVSEIIRGGIMSVDPGQMEAGRSLGMGYSTVMKDIVIPQAIKAILPSLGNELITLFKDTSLVSAIGLVELTKTAQNIGGRFYQFLVPYVIIALLYLSVVMILTWLQGILERRLRKSDRR